jgi:hypothetical protein
MQSTSYISASLRNRKERGLRGTLEQLFLSVGILLATSCGIGLSYLGLSSRNVLLLSLPLTSVWALASVSSFRVLIWPRILSSLARSDDRFKYEIYRKERINDRVEMIVNSKVDQKRKRQWFEDAYDEYFGEYKMNEAKLSMLNIALSKPMKIRKVSCRVSKSGPQRAKAAEQALRNL